MKRPQQQISSSAKRVVADDNDPNFDRKLETVTVGAKPLVKKHLLNKNTRDNCKVIVNYILTMQTEVSPIDSYRIDTIPKLKYLPSSIIPSLSKKY